MAAYRSRRRYRGHARHAGRAGHKGHAGHAGRAGHRGRAALIAASYGAGLEATRPAEAILPPPLRKAFNEGLPEAGLEAAGPAAVEVI